MGTSRAGGFPAANRLLTKPHLSTADYGDLAAPLQLCPSEDQQAPQLVRVEVTNCVEEVPIQRHCGYMRGGMLITDSGDFARGEKPGHRPPVGERPFERGHHPVGMIATKRITTIGATGQVFQPDHTVWI
jgi:hypothetical protein